MSLAKSGFDFPSDDAPPPRKAGLRPVLAIFEEAPLDIEVSLKAVFRKLWRGIHILLLCGALVAALPIIYIKVNIIGLIFTGRLETNSAPIQQTGGSAANAAWVIISPPPEIIPNLNGKNSGRSGYIANWADNAERRAKPVSDYEHFLGTLTTVRLAERVVEKYHMERLIVGGWNEKEQRWMQPTGLISDIRDFYRNLFSMRGWIQPGSNEVQQYLASILQTKITGTDFTRLTMIGVPANFGKTILEWAMNENDDLLREDARAEQLRRAAYLRERITTEPVTEFRTTLAEELAKTDRRLMTIDANRYFSFRLEDGPIMPTANSPWSSTVMVLTAFVIGVLFGSVIVLSVKERPRRRNPLRALLSRLQAPHA